MREIKVSLDFLGTHEIEGFTLDETWNGFACPYFTFEQAKRVVDLWQSCGSGAWYDADRDQFLFTMSVSKGPEEYDRFDATEIEGMKLYPVGAFAWIWSEAPN